MRVLRTVAILLPLLAAGAAPAAGVRGWSRTDLRPVSQPAPIANRFVLYAASGGRLWVMALDAASGRTVWKVEASTSFVTQGVAPGVSLAHGKVVYLRKTRAGPQAQVAALDPVTGRDVWRTPRGVFATWPVVCHDDRSLICISGGFRTFVDTGSLLRLSSRTGAVRAKVVISRSGDSREIGAGLFDAGTRTPERLVATRGPRVVWTRRLAEIFTLPRPSTDDGWNFERVGRAGLYVGNPGWPPVSERRRTAVFDLSRTMTAGFRIADGSTVWRDRGSMLVCSILPCAGGGQFGYSSDAGPDPDISVGLRTRAHGRMTVDYTILKPHLSPDARTTLEGFDPATGRTQWSFRAGHDPALLALTSTPPQVALHTVVLRDASGRRVAVELGSGARRRIDAQAPAWCQEFIVYKLDIPDPSTNSPTTDYVGQYSRYACTAGRVRLPRPQRVPAFIANLGARLGPLVAWSERGGVFARPID